jgi:hypothetical protein
VARSAVLSLSRRKHDAYALHHTIFDVARIMAVENTTPAFGMAETVSYKANTPRPRNKNPNLKRRVRSGTHVNANHSSTDANSIAGNQHLLVPSAAVARSPVGRLALLFPEYASGLGNNLGSKTIELQNHTLGRLGEKRSNLSVFWVYWAQCATAIDVTPPPLQTRISSVPLPKSLLLRVQITSSSSVSVPLGPSRRRPQEWRALLCPSSPSAPLLPLGPHRQRARTHG